VIEPVGFLARQRQHLLRARREIAHGFVTHTRNIMQLLCHFVQQSLGKPTPGAKRIKLHSGHASAIP
jgi:hypothetical protein